MFTVYADDVCIYSDVSPSVNYKVNNPTLNLADSAAGSFECTIPPGNAGYDKIDRFRTDIIVYEDKVDDDHIYWTGRVIKDEYDFWNNRKIYAEGALAFLNDTIQPPKEFLVENTTVRDFLETIINVHNSKVDTKRQFEIGTVTMNENIHRYTNYDSTLECINEKLVKNLGGHIRVRYQNGGRLIDYLKDYPDAVDQPIMFGKNLLDFSKTIDLTDLATVIIPRGARLEESKIENLDDYVTIESVNDGKNYIESEEAIKTFGRVEQVVDWDDVNEPEILLTKATEYLNDLQFNKLVLEIKAVDLKYLNPNIEKIHLLDQVECVSIPHGMNYKLFPVTKMTIHLDQPSQNTYTLGSDESMSLTAATKEISLEFDELPSESSILSSARKNAIKMLTGYNGEASYVVFVEDKEHPGHIVELAIMNNPTDDTSTAKWVWNQNGLGYLTRTDVTEEWGSKSTQTPVAITMDGSIVADYVTAGVMSGDRVRGGEFIVGGSGFGKDGKIYIKNTSDQNIATLDKDGLVFYSNDRTSWFSPNGVNETDVDGTGKNMTCLIRANGTYPFRVDTTGRVYAKRLFTEAIPTTDNNWCALLGDSLLCHTNIGYGYSSNAYSMKNFDLYLFFDIIINAMDKAGVFADAGVSVPGNPIDVIDISGIVNN